MSKKKIILVVGNAQSSYIKRLQAFAKKLNCKTATIYNEKPGQKKRKPGKTAFDLYIPCDFSDNLALFKCLLPYRPLLVAVTTSGDGNISQLRKIIPHVPYLKTPTADSLLYATDKIAMRKRFRSYDKKMTPNFRVIAEYSKETIPKIEKAIKYPVVVKPSSLSQSLLVSVCYDREDLEESLKKIFRRIKKVSKEENREVPSQVLVEHFMEGDMYSIDAYVNSRGKVYFCPIVKVKTGVSAGFDDFFGYQRLTPTLLSKENIKKAEEVSVGAIHAIGLRSSTAHIELIRTENEWKIIELGPRMGGYRHTMYHLSYGIDHVANDIRIRLPQKPIIPKKPKGFTAVMEFFAKEEGEITNLKGLKRARSLASFHSLKRRKKVGEQALFAKHGGKSLLTVTLFNTTRTKLLADIRRLEKMVKITTKTKKRSAPSSETKAR
jgi:biotin carboxylase